jgi:alkyl sulfatase BDS1-like metallo-beta-lactamase superfamily hydrolase
VTIDGDAARVVELFGLFDDFALMFEVVEPRRG